MQYEISKNENSYNLHFTGKLKIAELKVVGLGLGISKVTKQKLGGSQPCQIDKAFFHPGFINSI